MAWVYILKSVVDGRFYIGSTTDLERRLKQHSQHHTQSTARMGSLTLAFSQEFPSIEIARKVESRLKKLKRRDYIEKIVEDGYIRTEG
ncbi:GIY-YIG nuclease family protein [Candidatus Uhrbacteria bacterium]|nr:GIY-YIG nuclease family protein [Candidatus Uhrbacteria bacterium]